MAKRYIGNATPEGAQQLPWKKWIRASKNSFSLPIHITLDEHLQSFIGETMLRFLPKKRCVMSGTWEDKAIVAKLFYGRHAKQNFSKEIQGAKLLQEANVPSPRVLYQGSAYKKRVQVILFEKIEDAITLDTIWQKRDEYIEWHAILSSFMIELATQHVLGILQQDLHMNNFLVTNKRIYTLDGSTITYFESPLDKKKSLENLGLFFSQLGAGTQALQQELFQLYVDARGWLVKKADLEFLNDAIKNFSQERWRRYHKKIFRNSTSFKKSNQLFQRIIYDRQYQSPTFLKVLQDPDMVFADPQTILLKKGRSSTVAKIIIDNQFFVMKRYNIKSTLHWLRRCLRATRAKAAWRLAQRLNLFGVPTAKPVAYIEKHVLGLNGKSYFLMEYLPGTTSGEFFSHYKPNDPQFKHVAKSILQLLNALTECRLIHSDLKATNIIIQDAQPKLIDLDGMSEYIITASLQKGYKKTLKRFMKNWHDRPDVLGLFEKIQQEVNINLKDPAAIQGETYD